MKHINKLFILLAAIAVLTSCHRIKPMGDEEAVVVKKPMFFGHGGVEAAPISTGSEWAVFTTEEVMFKITPITYEEKFIDMMSDDNIPVDFSAFIKIQVKKGETPKLYENFGVDWFNNNIKQVFCRQVRNNAGNYTMFTLAGNGATLDTIGKIVYDHMVKYVSDLKMPINILEVTVGKATPPKEVLNETNNTAAQNQSKLTQDARANAELARKQAEINKADADKAYQKEMGMTIPEYLHLRHIEIEKEKVELIKDNKNATVIFGQSGIPFSYPVK